MAFCRCQSLGEIEIPASVEDIGKCCFRECCDLVRCEFASGSVLRRIGKMAFYSCRIAMIEIPASVEEIGGGCFMYCGPLVRCEFASDSALKRLGADAFDMCGIATIEIPAGVEILEE